VTLSIAMGTYTQRFSRKYIARIFLGIALGILVACSTGFRTLPIALGAGSLAVSTFYIVATGERKTAILPFLIALFIGALGFAHFAIAQLTPRTLDHSFLVLDQQWFFDGSSQIFAWSLAHRTFFLAMRFVYDLLPCAVIAVTLRQSSAEIQRLSRALITIGLFALPCYFVFPAVGPAHLNDHLAPRNCMPSLHAAWIFVLLFWKSPLSPYWQLALVGFVLITLVSTLTTGEHYIIDVIVGMIYATVIALFLKSRGQPALPSPSNHLDEVSTL